jgi:hypothetical protein
VRPFQRGPVLANREERGGLRVSGWLPITKPSSALTSVTGWGARLLAAGAAGYRIAKQSLNTVDFGLQAVVAVLGLRAAAVDKEGRQDNHGEEL